MTDRTLNQIHPSITIKKRPLYLTLIAIGLMVWGVGCTFSFGSDTIVMLSGGDGPLLPIFFLLYLHLIWICLFISGIGIIRAAPWSRLLLVGALIGLLVSSVARFTDGYNILSKVIFDVALIWSLFNRRSNSYFSITNTDA